MIRVVSICSTYNSVLEGGISFLISFKSLTQVEDDTSQQQDASHRLFIAL